MNPVVSERYGRFTSRVEEFRGWWRAGKRELPKRCSSAFGEAPRRMPPYRTIKRTPPGRGRPARIPSLGLPLGFRAMRHPATLSAGEAWARPKQTPGAVAGRAGRRRWPRLCQDLCGRDARAPGWASYPDVLAAKEVHRYSFPFVFIPGSPSTTIGSFFLA